MHSTRGHYCPKCKKHGHGVEECGDAKKLDHLNPYLEEKLPIDFQCIYVGCRNPATHVTQSHFCFECKKLVPCQHVTQEKLAKRPLPKVMVLSAAHSTKVVKPAKKFHHVICPMCRMKNYVAENQPKIFQETPSPCVVCTEQNVEVFLPQCGHSVLCRGCMETLSKDKSS